MLKMMLVALPEIPQMSGNPIILSARLPHNPSESQNITGTVCVRTERTGTTIELWGPKASLYTTEATRPGASIQQELPYILYIPEVIGRALSSHSVSSFIF